MYNYAKFRLFRPRAAGANLQRKGEGCYTLSTGLFVLECDRNLIKNHEADFFALNVARSEGTVFDVSNSHWFISLFRSFLYLLYHTVECLSIVFSKIF